MKRYSEAQLAFDLELDEVEDDAQERAISFEAARLISEAARQRFSLQMQALRGESASQRFGEVDELSGLPGWFPEYLGLVEKGWPWRVACYIAWAASPKDSRWPATLQELATQVLGLGSPRVVYTWRKKHPSIDTVIAMMQAAPLWEHRRDVLEALVTMAKTPDYKAFNDRKLFLEMIGDYVPKSQVEVGRSGAADELDGKSDDELRALAGEIASPQAARNDDVEAGEIASSQAPRNDDPEGGEIASSQAPRNDDPEGDDAGE